MSITTNRPAHSDCTDLNAAQKTFLRAWGDENGLEVSIKRPASADQAQEMAFIGYGDGIVSWIIYRADGHLWLCRIDDQAEQGCEGSKITVESVEEAAARIIVDTEA